MSSRSYILNVSQVHDVELDLAGEKAVNLGQLVRLGAPVPTGFIITTKAFDDFLFANNLITPISEVNRRLNRREIGIDKAERIITKAIMSGMFPNLLREMLYRTYSLLVDNRNITVGIDFSAVNSALKESVLTGNPQELLAGSFEEFLDKIKLAWTALFNKNALAFRIDNRYKGVLTQALLVNKFVQPELSGHIYTLSVDNADPTLVELRAVYGSMNEDIGNSLFPDRYLFKKDSEEIVAKFTNPQDWMLIARGSSFERASIAKTRQIQPKLTNEQIVKLSKTAGKLKEYFKNELKISWQFQSGKFVFTDFGRLTERDVVSARKLLNNKTADKKSNKTSNMTAKPSSQIQGVSLRPLDQLTSVASGLGNKQGIVYGRVKVVRKRQDLVSAEAVDILVYSKTMKSFQPTQIKYRGLVSETALDVTKTDIPAVTGVKDAGGLLLENEIITLDSNSGKIYLGAGYLPVVPRVEQPKVNKINPASQKINPIQVTMQSPATQGVFRAPVQPVVGTTPEWLPHLKNDVPEGKPLLQQETRIQDSPIPPVAKQIDEEWYLKQPVFGEGVSSEIKTAATYLQLLNIENPLILPGTKGIYLKLSSILQALDLDKYELVRNKPLKQRFLQFIADYLRKFSALEQVLLVLDSELTAKNILDNSELFEMQLELVKDLRNKAECKNIFIVLPDTRTERELIAMKKLVTSTGLRRTASFKVFVEMASPLAAISLAKMVEDGVDGLILDLDKLLQNLYEQEKTTLTEEVTDFLVKIIADVRQTTVPIFMAANKVALNDDNLRQLTDAGLANFVFPERKITELGPIIANMELKTLKKPKRGRKPKDIKYGY